MKYVHTFGTDRHNRQADVTLLFQYILSVGGGLERPLPLVLLDFSLTVKAATLIFISGCGSAISSAKEG